MHALLTKLNYKQQAPVVLLNAPGSFAPIAEELAAHATVYASAGKPKVIGFAIAFATKQREVDAAARALAAKLDGDALLWIAYPKGSSRNYSCDFNRDTGWAVLGELGFEPVRQVAIDDDWSALRFRKVGFIKKLTRSSALTTAGRARIKPAAKAAKAAKPVKAASAVKPAKQPAAARRAGQAVRVTRRTRSASATK